MQLTAPFIRIPLAFDAQRLAGEVAQFTPDDWRPHPQGHPGNWALPLVAIRGDPMDDGVAGPMSPTPHLRRCPYLRQALAAINAPLGRTRLMKLDARAEATRHVDINYYWQQRVRVHVPIVTFPEVEFLCGDASTRMAEGECWIFDTWRMHNVLNPTPRERIHLVADTVGSEAFWRMAEGAEPVQAVPFAPGMDPPLRFEASNLPVVMTPWEIDSLWSNWLADACAGPADPAVIDALNVAVQPVFREWRSLWAEHADQRAGWPSYARLMARLQVVAGQFTGRVPLPNGMDVARMLEQSLLGAIHTPALAAGEVPIPAHIPAHIPDLGQTSVASMPVAVPAFAAPAPIRFDRPLIILGAPRSGSSLLFETLTASPDVVTVGAESHLQFESIPALRPASRDFDSNRLDHRDATPGTLGALRRGFAEALRDREGRPCEGGALRLLEKTPKNALRLPLLDALFPDALYIYLYREPHENISSLIEGWESGRFVTYPDLPGWEGRPWSYLLVPGWRELIGQPLAAIASAQWRRTQEILLDDFKAIPNQRVHALGYRDFLADPARHVAEICAFAGIGWDRTLPATLPLSRHTVTPPHPDKWRRHEDAIAQYLPALRATDERARAFLADVRARLPRLASPNA
jgi:hypothetical protein